MKLFILFCSSVFCFLLNSNQQLIISHDVINLKLTNNNSTNYRTFRAIHQIDLDSSTVKKYHAYINRAELKAIKNSYKEASAIYDTSFIINSKPFGQDIYNASVCALKIEAYDKAVNYCLKLVRKGCPMSFFKKKAPFIV